MTANKVLLTKITILCLLTVLSIGNLRFIVDNILRSYSIDEEIVKEANPRLDKNKVAEAIATLEIIRKNELTTIFPSVTVENEATVSATSLEITIEIQNASGINGAAANLEEKLKNKGYKVNTISTVPTIQTKTTVLYKQGRIGEAEEIKKILTEAGLISELSQKLDKAADSDITIILGR